MTTPLIVYTVRSDGNQYAVIHNGLTETPVDWRPTRAEADERAAELNHAALHRLAVAGFLERRQQTA